VYDSKGNISNRECEGYTNNKFPLLEGLRWNLKIEAAQQKAQRVPEYVEDS
jgi:hypothetical protein